MIEDIELQLECEYTDEIIINAGHWYTINSKDINAEIYDSTYDKEIHNFMIPYDNSNDFKLYYTNTSFVINNRYYLSFKTPEAFLIFKDELEVSFLQVFNNVDYFEQIK